MSLASAPHRRVRALLGNRDLMLLLGAGLISQTGDWMLATGVAFQVYALTGSTMATAAALLATQIPQVVFGSPAGVAADRWDRRRLMIAVNLLLAAIMLPLLLVHDAGRIWVVLAVVAASSCLTPFFVAAEATLFAALVDPGQRVTANALNAQVRNVARLVGAALGGVVVAFGGLPLLAYLDVATFLIAAALIVAIRHRPIRESATHHAPVTRELLDGLAAIRGSRALLVVVFFYAASGVGEAVMGTLFAPFVSDVLHATAQTYGTILSVQAVGGILGGLLLTALGHRLTPRALFGWGAVMFGLLDLALFLYPLLTDAVWPALVLIGLVGVPGAALFAGALTVFQTATEDTNRGRVFGTLTTLQNAAMLIGTPIAGLLAGHLGIVAVISIQGVGYVVAGLVALVGLRRLAASAGGAAAADSGDAAPDALDEALALEDVLDNPAAGVRMPTMGLPSNVRLRTVSDPLALRAFAHPLRLELHGLVAREGTLTAADAARQLDISHALASHHLRQLAKYGFIEPADSNDGRAHPWRVTATSTEFRPEEPGAYETKDAIERYVAERAIEELADWQQRREGEDPAWVEHAGAGNSLLYLTPDEFAELMRSWRELILPLADRRPVGHRDKRPDDAVPVALTLIAVPIPATEQGG
ncbi:MAG: MFS transporter [Microlunatus sp.]